ncbi:MULTISPECIES: efflux RND transporter periplasmic adaptor subunit [Methylomonas]|uniref:Efflux transporter periplasmic adaptor subunit n=1 Tax=Methylomonas koyamae TaxID=702114 RepID=A0A177NPQ5_9GAMM|nr:efflux RND transporter periplasmic adaptor subunit [Methylomonas koyamae]OAI20037.1 efflux transporter periplasmic adaptor subunit [Methylomonas koyamae]
MIKRSLLVLLLTLLALGAIFGLKFYRMRQAASQVPAVSPAVVAFAEVKSEHWDSSLSTVGSFRAVAGIDISNEIAGMVQAIHFNSGQTVKAGQLLLELDSATDRAELDGLLAEQKLAGLRYQRGQSMLERKFIAAADQDQNRAQLDQAAAAVAGKQIQIAKKHIKAPFAGELGIRRVDLGQYLPVGSAIVMLEQLDPMYLDFTLPERDLGRIGKGQKVIASVPAFPDQYFEGEVTASNPAVDTDSRTIKVQALFRNPGKLLRPGMFAQIKLSAEADQTVSTLPDTAISYNPYGNSVFAVQRGPAGWIVQSRQVKTGDSRGGRVEILEGLRLGDKVVAAGQMKLRNGMAVTPDSQPAPGEREQAP